MATTTNYSWTTPDDTALVKDGAAAIRSLGTAIDTTVFNNASAAIGKTIVDAKGDIIAATAADTVARLAVGSNDQVLTADSSTATGLKWATPASGGMTLISTTTLSGSSVSLTSIPQTYNNLYLVLKDYIPATNAITVYLRINGDSGTNYVNSTAAGINPNFTYILCAYDVLNTSASKNLTVVDIFDYTNSTTFKMVHKTFINAASAGAGKLFAENPQIGGYNQTAAITSLDILPSSGNWTSGTALLYGVK